MPLLLFISHILQLHNPVYTVILRSIIAFLLCFLGTLFYGGLIINKLKKLQKFCQPIRDDGPSHHIEKRGTPTMGGLIILGFTFIGSFLCCDISNEYIIILLLTMLIFGALGFIDDYIKVIQYHHRGIIIRYKLLLQSIAALVVCYFIQKCSGPHTINCTTVPFFQDLLINLGYFYIPFTVLVVVGASNAVNFTDGLDGLAIMPICIALFCLGLISYIIGHEIHASNLRMIYINGTAEIFVLCAALIGSSLGFLWYNTKPADMFMGDVGSLSLGAVLGAISVIIKHELLFSIIGAVFVVEAMSVIIQITYFKLTNGKRFFLMAPLHHHFEQKNISETKIVTRVWIIAIIFAVLGLSSVIHCYC